MTIPTYPGRRGGRRDAFTASRYASFYGRGRATHAATTRGPSRTVQVPDADADARRPRDAVVSPGPVFPGGERSLAHLGYPPALSVLVGPQVRPRSSSGQQSPGGTPHPDLQRLHAALALHPETALLPSLFVVAFIYQLHQRGAWDDPNLVAAYAHAAESCLLQAPQNGRAFQLALAQEGCLEVARRALQPTALRADAPAFTLPSAAAAPR